MGTGAFFCLAWCVRQPGDGAQDGARAGPAPSPGPQAENGRLRPHEGDAEQNARKNAPGSPQARFVPRGSRGCGTGEISRAQAASQGRKAARSKQTTSGLAEGGLAGGGRSLDEDDDSKVLSRPNPRFR